VLPEDGAVLLARGDPQAVTDHVRHCLGLAPETEPGHGAARTAKWHRGQVRKRQGVTYDMGRARALAEAAIREAAQVRNHPPDLINVVVALNRAVAITERDGPEHGLAALEAIVGMERSHLACRIGRQLSKAWPGRRGSRGAGNCRRIGAHRGRTAAASVSSPRCEARARLTDSRAAGVLYWFRRSSSHQTQIPLSEITLERRSR
jgi:hypothetical protein